MGFWSGLAKVGGAVGGFMVGGPQGAVAGYKAVGALTNAAKRHDAQSYAAHRRDPSVQHVARLALSAAFKV